MKKGLVYGNDGSATAKVSLVNASWHYNWNTTIPKDINVPYVPQIWGLKTLALINQLNSPIDGYENVLLGYNEPDGVKQSNITVDDAISHWPTLEATGRRLGSPATAGNPASVNSWLSQFMSKAKENNKKVDFICVHWYAPPNAKSFLAEIDSIYAMYNLPIWITEFSPADWKASPTVPCKYTSDDAINFMKTVIPELNSRDFVERYTWKTRTTSDVNLGFAALFNDDGTLTDVGKSYASL